MNADELKELEAKRQRAHIEAHRGDDLQKRKALAELVRQLDQEINVGRQQVRQQAVENEVKRRLRVGFEGDDQAFERIWQANRDKLLLEHTQAQAQRAEADSAQWLRNLMSG